MVYNSSFNCADGCFHITGENGKDYKFSTSPNISGKAIFKKQEGCPIYGYYFYLGEKKTKFKVLSSIDNKWYEGKITSSGYYYNSYQNKEDNEFVFGIFDKKGDDRFHFEGNMNDTTKIIASITSPGFSESEDTNKEALNDYNTRNNAPVDYNATTAMQQFLVDSGEAYDLGHTGVKGDGVDGHYGPKTTAAVQQYMIKHNITFEQFKQLVLKDAQQGGENQQQLASLSQELEKVKGDLKTAETNRTAAQNTLNTAQNTLNTVNNDRLTMYKNIGTANGNTKLDNINMALNFWGIVGNYTKQLYDTAIAKQKGLTAANSVNKNASGLFENCHYTDEGMSMRRMMSILAEGVRRYNINEEGENPNADNSTEQAGDATQQTVQQNTTQEQWNDIYKSDALTYINGKELLSPYGIQLSSFDENGLNALKAQINQMTDLKTVTQLAGRLYGVNQLANQKLRLCNQLSRKGAKTVQKNNAKAERYNNRHQGADQTQANVYSMNTQADSQYANRRVNKLQNNIANDKTAQANNANNLQNNQYYTGYNNANNSVNNAQTAYNAANTEYGNAQTAVNNAQTAYDTAAGNNK